MEQLKTILETLKQCYIERDKDNIDKLSKLLFCERRTPIIMGTSNNELCFGVQECEKLFLSDWKDWGNVGIEVENAVYGSCGRYVWFHVPASVEFCFENNADTYAAFMNMTMEIVNGNKTPLSKAGDFLWLLTHLLHDRPSGERKYDWDMTITGVLEDVESQLKIRIMQFSMPVLSAYPDVRIDINEDDAHHFQNECDEIRYFNASRGIDANKVMVSTLLSKLLLDDAADMLVCDGVKRYIGCDGISCDGFEYSVYMSNLRERGIKAELLQENVIFMENDDTFAFCGVGLFTRKISLDSELNNIYASLKQHKNLGDSKEALFKIRRDLAAAIKESSVSNSSKEPFRVEGVGRLLANSSLVIEYMQLSYPFNHVLEQKTDAAKLIT